MRKPCSKAQNGKCLGGACQNHVGYCRGRSNLHTETAPAESVEDALIAAIDLGFTGEDIVRLAFPAVA